MSVIKAYINVVVNATIRAVIPNTAADENILNAILSEDEQSYLLTEDGVYYVAQNAVR